MFCLFSPSNCVNLLQLCGEERIEVPADERGFTASCTEQQLKMHSSDLPPAQPATGPNLLLQLGKLIIRARSASPAGVRAPANPTPRISKLPSTSTSQQIQIQPQFQLDEDEEAVVEEDLSNHVNMLWTDMEPVCIEVLLTPACVECSAAYERPLQRALLLERWTMYAISYKGQAPPALINSQWLSNAVRSQLHFSQLSAWLARLHSRHHHRRKLSREQCNYKKIEANCDPDENDQRKLNIVYSIKTPGQSKMAEFAKPSTDHTFPFTDLGNNTYLKITLESLPRLDDIPTIKCSCQTQKRRPSKDTPGNVHEELVGRLNDLSIGSRKYDGAINSNIGTPNRRLSIISNPGSTEYLFTAVNKDKVVDDRMLTPCSENGKHKCNCDEESDGNKDIKDKDKQPPKKLDERRLKEIAKYKRRIRKEKMKKLCDSTSSEGEGLKSKETTSIPILQASRFDRFRAIGCYRNQTYLTLPATRIETKSPFIEADVIVPPDFKKTNTVGTQTDNFICQCGNQIDLKCESCHRGMVRSEANYNLASLTDDKQEIGARRKLDIIDDDKLLKKHKCDTSIKCDSDNINLNDGLIKRPKLRRVFPIVDRLDKIVNDRHSRDTEKDIKDLHLNTDDSVFSVPKDNVKRQKTFSISDDEYVLYEKCDYGTIDHHDIESPKDEYSPDYKFALPRQEGPKNDSFDSNNSLEALKDGFVFPDPKNGHHNPTTNGTDKFRYKFPPASPAVPPWGSRAVSPAPPPLHRTPAPSPPAPSPPVTSPPALRRNHTDLHRDNNSNHVNGIKSGVNPPCSPAAPASPRAPALRKERTKLRMGPSSGLLGSFEESALQGRLEAVATVHGFTAELGASGAFCPPHKRLPVTVFFYAPGGTNAPYMGHINLGPQGYRVAHSGSIQVSLFNPHGTLVKMFVVVYSLAGMPPAARTFLRQRTLYVPAGGAAGPARPAGPAGDHHKWLRYLIHLRFMTSKSGKLYLHTDIRLIVSRKADLDTATAHSALFRPIPTNNDKQNDNKDTQKSNTRAPNRVFGGSSDFDSERPEMRELGYENQNSVSYELRSFTYAPDNPKYSPR